MGKFLRRHLLDMDLSCDIYEKRRWAICHSVDIVIMFALIQSAYLVSKGHPRSKVNVKSEKADMVSY